MATDISLYDLIWLPSVLGPEISTDLGVHARFHPEKYVARERERGREIYWEVVNICTKLRFDLHSQKMVGDMGV